MNSRNNFSKHTAALSALFVLGNAVTVLPDVNADKYCFSAYIAATAAAFVLYFAFYPAISRFFDFSKTPVTEKGTARALRLFIFPVTALASLWCLADTFYDFFRFSQQVILSDISQILVLIPVLTVCVVFATRRHTVCLKFALIAFWMSAILMLFFFLAISQGFNSHNIFVFALPRPIPFFKQMLPYIVNPVLPSLLLPVYNMLVIGKAEKSATLKGLTLGYILLGFSVLSSVLLFGTEYAAKTDYPYSQAISTAAGKLFTRMDGFAYFIYFATAVVKITVCFQIMRICLKKTAALTARCE